LTTSGDERDAAVCSTHVAVRIRFQQAGETAGPHSNRRCSRLLIPGERMECLRFALLFNGSSLERWHLRCLDHLEESAKLTGVILAADSPSSPAKASGSALMHLYAKSVSTRRVDVTKRFANMRRFYWANRAEPVEPRDLDFVLKLGPGSIPRACAQGPRTGSRRFPPVSRFS
jgi:hypothetical protein